MFQPVLAASVALAVCACFTKPPPPAIAGDGGPGDGGPGDGAAVDASTCTMYGPWSAPIELTTLNSMKNDWQPTLSGDNQRLIFYSDRMTDPAKKLFEARWNPSSEQFDAPVPFELASFGQGPRLSRDGLRLWYTTYNGTQDIATVTRPTLEDPFLDANHTVFEPFATTEFDEDRIGISGDMLSAVVMLRPAGAPMSNVFISHRATTSEPFSVPVQADALVDDSYACCASLSSDGLMVLWEGSPGDSYFAVHQATRASRTEQFGTPTRFVPLDTTVRHGDAMLSDDGTILLYTRWDQAVSPEENWDLYMMKRDCLSP